MSCTYIKCLCAFPPWVCLPNESLSLFCNNCWLWIWTFCRSSPVSWPLIKYCMWVSFTVYSAILVLSICYMQVDSFDAWWTFFLCQLIQLSNQPVCLFSAPLHCGSEVCLPDGRQTVLGAGVSARWRTFYAAGERRNHHGGRSKVSQSCDQSEPWLKHLLGLVMTTQSPWTFYQI